MAMSSEEEEEVPQNSTGDIGGTEGVMDGAEDSKYLISHRLQCSDPQLCRLLLINACGSQYF